MFRFTPYLIAICALGLLAPGAIAQPAEATRTLFVTAMDYSGSAAYDQGFFVKYLESHLLPEVHPGDRLIVGRIGTNALSSFQVLEDQCLPQAAFQAPRVLSWKYWTQNQFQAQAQCVERYNKFERALQELHQSFHQALSRPATDTQTCLIDTVWLLAGDFARYRGLKVFVLASDGIEECRGINFARTPPTRETLERLKAQNRIPCLTGVQVYFICRSSHPPYSYDSIDSFWQAFFEMAAAKSVQVGPAPEIDHASAATRQGQCGR